MEDQQMPTPSSGANPAAPAPIMDIKAPPQPAGPPEVVPEPAGMAPAEANPTAATQPDKPATAAQAPPRKPPTEGVNAAIFATVVIVLGLAVLAVYAYIKTK